MPSMTAGGMHTHHEVSLRYVHAAATIMSVSSVVSNRRRRLEYPARRERGCAAALRVRAVRRYCSVPGVGIVGIARPR